jgi:hypothetical protein
MPLGSGAPGEPESVGYELVGQAGKGSSDEFNSCSDPASGGGMVFLRIRTAANYSLYDAFRYAVHGSSALSSAPLACLKPEHAQLVSAQESHRAEAHF